MKKPVIGVNLDFEEEGGGFSPRPWHALRSNYFDVIRDAGGIPVGIPCTYTTPTDYISVIDGLLATGGNDYDPKLYGETITSKHADIMRQRSIFDIELLRVTLHAKKPIFGICAGAQILNIAYGGTLHQYLPDTFKTDINHRATGNPKNPAHPVSITPGTHLHSIVHTDEIMVNSWHNQAFNKIGHGLVINAMCLDGVVEGVEDPTQKFCIGVQWHPEYIVTPNDAAIIQAFVDACR